MIVWILELNSRESRDETRAEFCWMLASILRTELYHFTVSSRNMIKYLKRKH